MGTLCVWALSFSPWCYILTPWCNGSMSFVGPRQHLVLPAELKTDGKAHTQGGEMEPRAGLVRKVAGQCGCGFSSKGKSIPLPSELEEPRLSTCPLIPTPLTWGLGKAGRKWSAWRGLILSLPSSSGSLKSIRFLLSFRPRRRMGTFSVPSLQLVLCCQFSASCIGPCPKCLNIPSWCIWVMPLEPFLEAVFLSQVHEHL